MTNPGRLYLSVAAGALLAYLAALGNGFALDDVPIIATNPLVHHWSGILTAFRTPYWPPSSGAAMYRPLVLASLALDWQTGQLIWLHLVNVLWHAATSVAVAMLTKRWSGSQAAALLAGGVFAVHPVHVEAVANLVGRAELMAAVFAMLSVYGALQHDRLGWSLVAFTLGLLSKESAAVVPGLIVAGWLTGIGMRPTRRRALAYLAGWSGVAVAYGVVRWTLLHSYSDQVLVAPVFVGAGFADTRLTAIASCTDFARLLLFPLTLRADYSPAERTLVTAPSDPRFLLGALCLLIWGGLILLSWRRRRRLIAFGLCWMAIALLPVANLLFPSGVLVAERTLYLPSAGVAIALGDALSMLRGWRLAIVVAAILVAGGVRTVTRIPVWKDSAAVLKSVQEDSPRSYVGPMWTASAELAQHHAEDALRDFRVAAARSTGVPKLLTLGADAAFALRRSPLADSLLLALDGICERCPVYYEFEARAALARGDTAVADSFLVRARRD
jgi:protein O-mannosyl-transferase